MKRISELFRTIQVFFGETPWAIPATVILVNTVYLFLMTLHRFVFFVWFADLSDFSGMYGDVIESFFLGFRFDFKFICYVNGPVFLSFIPVFLINREHVTRVWKNILPWYYFILLTLVFTLNFTDFGFYTFFKDHINILIFGMIEDDTAALFSSIAENFNVPFLSLLIILFFAAVFSIAFFPFKNIKQFSFPMMKTWKKSLLIAALFLMLFLGGRGTLGMYPLGMMDTDISPSLFLCKLAPNGPFYMYEAMKNRSYNRNIAQELGYGKNPEQAFADLLEKPVDSLQKPLSGNIIRTVPSVAEVNSSPNVVLIMMESFGYDLLRYNSSTFNVLGDLSPHLQQDILFSHFISSTVGTIGNLESVLINIPKRPGSRPVSQSEFSTKHFQSGCAIPFKEKGYETLFVSSGSPGWRNLQTLLPNTGFDAVLGWKDMPEEYGKNQWGVFDEHLFDYIFNRLSEHPEKPKFIFGLTTTNHPPYSLPSSYTPLPLEMPDELKKRIHNRGELTAERFRSYQYANNMLGKLISRIKNSELGSNTIIAVTADDNTVELFDYTSSELLDRFRIPFYLYLPPGFRPASVNTAVFGTHTDIMPTLYNRALPGVQYMSLGRDLLSSENRQNFAVNAHGLILGNQGGALYRPDGSFRLFTWSDKKEHLLQDSEGFDGDQQMETHFRALYSVADFLIKEKAEDRK